MGQVSLTKFKVLRASVGQESLRLTEFKRVEHTATP